MTGLAELSARLGQLDLDAVLRRALEAAQRIESAVRESLSHTPGGQHETPWLRTAQLRDSIAREADGTQAVIGSSNMIAVYQELGTRSVPPRPFLAPAAGAHGQAVAEAIGNAAAEALRSAAAGKTNVRV
jgi:HK97 gp10 family phage protein